MAVKVYVISHFIRFKCSCHLCAKVENNMCLRT